MCLCAVLAFSRRPEKASAVASAAGTINVHQGFGAEVRLGRATGAGALHHTAPLGGRECLAAPANALGSRGDAHGDPHSCLPPLALQARVQECACRVSTIQSNDNDSAYTATT